jgi:hypothetical protein
VVHRRRAAALAAARLEDAVRLLVVLVGHVDGLNPGQLSLHGLAVWRAGAW